MGANVIKVEAREEIEGDSTALGIDFLNLQRNKRAMTLDLKHPRGIEVLKRLVARADVLVENFRPDVKTQPAFGYNTHARLHPLLTNGRHSRFGQMCPHAPPAR